MTKGNYGWQQQFRQLYDKAMVKYRNEHSNVNLFFTPREVRLLRSIGAKPMELFDFVEDSSDLDAETALLIVAARRDYFITVQKEVWTEKAVSMDSLPAKDAQLEGIAWLPRIIAKAQARLRGELADDVMYCCGGDRKFLRAHDTHPADFLRAVWAAKGSTKYILSYLQHAENPTR